MINILIEVVAALIWEDDKFLICQRPAHKSQGLLWEFVGGKVENGETKEQALIRECREELDVTLSVGEIFMDVIHEYPDITVHLTLLYAAIVEGVPKKIEHNDIRWITIYEIPQYTFCPADEKILKKLQTHTNNLFELPPLPLSEELVTLLCQSKDIRIERIISTGQVSDWYDQEEHEFVSLLQGEAELTWEDGSTTKLIAGETKIIPPHKRHRVSYTSSDPPCIWLCVFW